MGWLARLRSHQVPLVVFGGLLVLGLIELSDPDFDRRATDSPRVYLDPETNIADVSAELYPDRSLSLYYQAFQASLCGEGESEGVCAERGPAKPGEVRELFERAIATGNRANELTFYNYALVLLQEGAPAEEVDAAVRSWRRTYPRSQRKDPREVYAEMLRTAERGR